LHPEIEPTNNKAERALREFVVQRKITGTLRNEKGTRITETIMTAIATWKLQGHNPYRMLKTTLSS
ncbi:MAG: transposase, partial [Nanoarchaeota archaeon]|nr:transposase [Nanoarchaeota archaeon]